MEHRGPDGAQAILPVAGDRRFRPILPGAEAVNSVHPVTGRIACATHVLAGDVIPEYCSVPVLSLHEASLQNVNSSGAGAIGAFTVGTKPL